MAYKNRRKHMEGNSYAIEETSSDKNSFPSISVSPNPITILLPRITLT